ncbi:MAG: DNA-binding transcriptional LysR family regulator [Gammaproteobacteria bacterium]|jgi:DNA-binding transcriptional LysR family regulator
MKGSQTLSLNAIKSFKTAARHLSFFHAAQDLKVHLPAVSRQVLELERRLGVLLFIRSKHRLSLAAQGQELFASVSTEFNKILQSIERLRHQAEKRLLKLETSRRYSDRLNDNFIEIRWLDTT